ncbi:Copper amine oxidase N-terminal domain-containing protein [Desulfotomaculum arcticum]|uniref:Copper amine oxidase N-terminal domain-containing protein n=1 Tax=Desulfotruncus arcticus DSM 17038 TaxID=1121424 RepID=A0A1I2X0C4_9FIRM|nr:copper amine oxidase N-terminal domain-containing protein [Desulfotruncus arcticus]SFH07024.1 Copper amine oxidase N-terminal domain-containing protein [Desulfotomaculum arcticum] [Desulfotruncus arcticus DSM 17038]
MRLKVMSGLFISVALFLALTVGAYGQSQSSVIDSTYGQNDQPSVIDQVYNGDSDSAGTVTPQPTPPIGSGITVYVNYEPLTFDVSPSIIDGRAMVPLQEIMEALNAEVTWDNSTKTITATREGTTVALTINQAQAKANNQVVAMDVPAQLIDEHTMVPLRFISESLGAKVNWDETTKVVTINL